jgi:hypothetical protein
MTPEQRQELLVASVAVARAHWRWSVLVADPSSPAPLLDQAYLAYSRARDHYQDLREALVHGTGPLA